jgi:hypothetical protein
VRGPRVNLAISVLRVLMIDKTFFLIEEQEEHDEEM